MSCAAEEGGAGFRFDASRLPGRAAGASPPGRGAAASSRSSFSIGDSVKIDGLGKRADLNGQWGVCQGDPDPASGRVELIASSGEVVKVKVENLHDAKLSKSTPVRVVALTGKPELNGVVGMLGSFDEGSGRWLVEMPEGNAVKLQPKNIVRVH
eukprot:TRINITY_DN93527_c0_g1_i1.p2 TRINITY_DN93527_c0_g1~~TRINITY_DN93527_c0_g1_i1.p2  ORF type:complete len:154 (-),score=44.01 TRINITY_DN93527_c0_g1_i1:58-519(-)